MAATIGAGAKIGRECWISNAANIRYHLSICDGTVIGTGANVVKDITEKGIYAGNPARFIKPVPERYIW